MKPHLTKTLQIVIGIIFIGVLGMGIWSFLQKKPGAGNDGFQHVSAKAAYALIQEHANNADFIILDVRTPAEFQQGHLHNAKNIDFHANTFRGHLDKLDKRNTYLVYCQSGNRSGKTLRMMAQAGFQQAYNMQGGIVQWARQQLPLTR